MLNKDLKREEDLNGLLTEMWMCQASTLAEKEFDGLLAEGVERWAANKVSRILEVGGYGR